MDRPLGSALRTPLCDLLGVSFPLIQAPMAGGWTTPDLVAAVCEAGGLGVLAGARVSPERLAEDIGEVRTRTDRPFGVNFLLAPPEAGGGEVAAVQRFLDRFRERFGLPPGGGDVATPDSRLGESIGMVLEERVPVLSTAMGDAGDLVGPAHERGMVVMSMVTTVEEAILAAEGGADVIVAQGADAGGHRSTSPLGTEEEPPLVGTMALVPQVVDAVEVPVVAAGGIADGRGLLASLALGAAGAQVGTRFLLACESGAHATYRRRLRGAVETETVVTRAFTGRPARALRNRFVEKYRKEGPMPLPWPLQSVAAEDIYAASLAADEEGYLPLLAGQGLRMVREEAGAAEIVEEIVAGAEAALRRLAGAGT
jgi:nitronate monooxygenase